MSRRSDPPVVALTTYVEEVSRTPWVDQPSAVLPRDYTLSVERAGALPVLLVPRLDVTPAVVSGWLDRVDALIISGGVDVESSRYGAPPHPSVQQARPDRDETELLLVAEARRRGMPLLGICRGMQVMAVETGGTLEQHLPDRVGHDEHSPAPGVFGTHAVSVRSGSRVAAIVGEQVDVPTYHHQAVLTHPGYDASAWTADGTLEAMEDPDADFCLAVQWHPEAGTDPSLFEALVAATR